MWKIMLVEDESLLRKALRKTISGNPDYDVCYEAVNGISALEYLQSHKVDIIVSDIRMPGWSGVNQAHSRYEYFCKNHCLKRLQ